MHECANRLTDGILRFSAKLLLLLPTTKLISSRFTYLLTKENYLLLWLLQLIRSAFWCLRCLSAAVEWATWLQRPIFLTAVSRCRSPSSRSRVLLGWMIVVRTRQSAYPVTTTKKVDLEQSRSGRVAFRLTHGNVSLPPNGYLLLVTCVLWTLVGW